MAYLDSQEEGDRSMPGNWRPCSGVGGGASGDPRDTVKTGLSESQSPEDAIDTSVGKTPETGAASCTGVQFSPVHPSGSGAIPSEGIEGDEWDTYLALERRAKTNVGSPSKRECGR